VVFAEAVEEICFKELASFLASASADLYISPVLLLAIARVDSFFTAGVSLTAAVAKDGVEVFFDSAF